MKTTLSVVFLGSLAAVLWFRLKPEPVPEIGSARLEQAKRIESRRVVCDPLHVTPMATGLPDKGEWRGKPVMRDLNGDGHVDIAASIRRFDKMRIADGIHVFLGDGKGTWKACDRGLAKDMGYGGIDAGDVNGDGKPDLIYSGHDLPPRVFVNFLAHGDDNEWAGMDSVAGLEGISCSDVALGDFDKDGHADLAIMGFFPKTGGLYVMANKGNGEFGPKVELMPARDYGAIVRFIDVDGDGRVELLAATSVGAKVWRLVDGKWTDDSAGLPETWDVGQISGIVRGIDARDIDGDGKAEIAIAGLPTPGHAPVRIYRREGDRWVDWGKGLPAEEASYDVVFAKLAGGSQGLFLANQHGVLVVRCGKDGANQLLGRIEGTEGVLNVGAGDVNGDGADEVLIVGQKGLSVFAIDSPALAAQKVNDR